MLFDLLKGYKYRQIDIKNLYLMDWSRRVVREPDVSAYRADVARSRIDKQTAAYGTADSI